MPRLFLVSILLILSLRISLFFLPSFQFDMGDWKAWSIRLSQVGPSSFYASNYFSDYFPGYLYILWIIGSFFKFFSIPINSVYFEVFIKGITTLFDIASALFIYKICSNYAKKWKYLVPIFYLLNPAVIFNSSVWGQIDGIFTFFLIFSSYLLTERESIFKSSFFSSLGILVKPHSLILLPVSLIWSFKNYPQKKFYKSVVLGILMFILFSLPFFPKKAILGIFELATKSQDVYKFTSLYAFNFWSLVGWWRPDDTVFIVSYKILGIILFLISMALIIIPLLKKKIEKREYYLAASLSFLSFFLLLTRMHERYLFPFLAFILLSAIIYKSRFLFTVYVISSLVHFINLLFVYYYYVFIYNNFNLTKNLFYPLYILVNDNYKIFSLLMLILFLSTLIFYYKPYVKKSKILLT